MIFCSMLLPKIKSPINTYSESVLQLIFTKKIKSFQLEIFIFDVLGKKNENVETRIIT